MGGGIQPCITRPPLTCRLPRLRRLFPGHATEELHRACPNVRVKVGDVEIDQHFFVQETSSHPVILGEPYITTARMETKVLDNGLAYA